MLLFDWFKKKRDSRSKKDEFGDFRVHVIKLLTKQKYLCLSPASQIDDITIQELNLQFERHYLGEIYSFAAKQGLSNVDLGVFDILKKHLVGLSTSRTSSNTALTQIGERLHNVDLIGLRISIMEGNLVALINGDRQSKITLPAIAEDLQGIAESFMALLGNHKIQIAGMNIGKGVGTNLGGYVLFTFTDSAKLIELRSHIEKLQVGTTTAQQWGKFAKQLVINPWIWGEKGSFLATKLIIRLFDHTVEGRQRLGQKRYIGFSFEDLLPSRSAVKDGSAGPKSKKKNSERWLTWFIDYLDIIKSHRTIRVSNSGNIYNPKHT